MNDSDASRRVLVTGVNGFSGRHLATSLSHDSRLTVFGTGRRAATTVPLAGYRPVDLTDDHSVRELVAWAVPDTVYHLAGSWNAGGSAPLDEVNVRGFERLRDALRAYPRHRPVRVLVIGSAAEIGPVTPGQLPVDESVACHPVTSYGRSKHALVQAALAERRDSGLEIVVARPFNLIGAGLSELLAPGRFAAAVRAVARGDTDTIHCGWLEGRRDFLDVVDAIRAYQLLMDQAPPGTLAHVCSGRSVRTGDVLEGLLRLARVSPRIVAADHPRDGDIPDIRGSHALLTLLTGWQPAVPLSASLTALLQG